jgi:phosphoglucosamine mutase
MNADRFGTDGIRGVAGETLTEETAARLGAALATHFPGSLALIGRDTRPSGPALVDALIAALRRKGSDAIDLGVIPTPGLAALVAGEPRVAYGVVVTASHNPVEYNGLKVLGRTGRKIPDADERALEALMEAEPRNVEPAGAEMIPPKRDWISGEPVLTSSSLRERYSNSLVQIATREAPASAAEHITVVADASFGAASTYIVAALEATGATVIPFATSEGTINDGVGATSPAALAAQVVALGANVGVALDGDADRCVAVDERGHVVDGDVLIALMALDRHARGLDGSQRAVATVLTNSAIERRLLREGITLERTPVGDRHVAERLVATGAGFGGEKSGHLLFPEYAPTGDGIISAISLVGLLARATIPLSLLVTALELDPQVQAVIAVGPGGAEEILADPDFTAVAQAAAEELSALGGRLLIRPSGTEPLVRVMGEAPDAAALHAVVDRVVKAATRVVRGG